MKFIVCVFMFLVILEGFHCAPNYYSSSSITRSNHYENKGEYNTLLVGPLPDLSRYQDLIMATMSGGNEDEKSPCC
uniref:SFRICE_001886 n=1 Tax=Spodoptera frugiperda TaxID=7108 RepID=A0A2H1VBL7_SPOFR